MGRDPNKTEQVVIWMPPELKRRWAAWATVFDTNATALSALLDVKDDNPEVVKNYRR